MIRNNIFRHLLGALLGGLAGLSFCVSILPVALETVGAADQIFLTGVLAPYAMYSAMLWAVGGWATARAGFLKAGVIIMAVVGLSSGALLVVRAITPDPAFLAAGAAGGLVYGLVGGLLLGRVLARPAAE